MLTIYAFSRENWARSDDEVSGLFDLLGRAIASETDELAAQGVRVKLLGRLDELPEATRDHHRRGPRPRPRRHAAPPQRRVELRGPHGARRRVPGDRRLGRPARPDRRADDQRGAVHRRPPGPRPRHPHRRRAADQQLPHLAVRLRGARVRRLPVARLRPGRLRRGAARVRPAHAPVRPVAPRGAADPSPLGPSSSSRSCSSRCGSGCGRSPRSSSSSRSSAASRCSGS